MADSSALHDYFKKIQKALDTADFSILNFKIVKKSKIDDLLVCTLALLPESFKKAMKKRLNIDMFPAVSCYNRLSKMLKKPFILSSDYYIVQYSEASAMIKSIRQNLDRDIRQLEENG